MTFRKLFNISNALILIAIILFLEILMRLRGPNAYEIQFIRPFETNFQYDSHFGWIGKPNYSMEMEYFGTLNFDDRGFPIVPDVKNDKVKNDKKILFIGRCDIYGGPMLGPEKGFMGLLAREIGDRVDFDVMGVGGYSFYQEYLVNQKYNSGGYNLVIVSFCPFLDLYLNTQLYMHGFGNRLVPHPKKSGDKITHTPVPYVKSYWEDDLPKSKRFSLKEKIFLKSYLLSKIINKVIEKRSFDIDLTKFIIKEFKKDVESKGGKLVFLIFNWCPDTPEPQLTKITDEFIAWLVQNNIDCIDLREKLIGESLAKMGDPTHVSVDGQKIMKEEILSYLNKTGFLVDTVGGSL
jgi:hypothetical protein